MNPRTHCDVMVLSPETESNSHPFWYARVLGVFHAKVLHTGPQSRNRSIQHLEFLWVRWFGMEPGRQYGCSKARLPRIGFVPEGDPSAFGFLDPSLVLRGCHLVPAFAEGRTSALLKTIGPTAARPLDETDDWAKFYVIMQVLFHSYNAHLLILLLSWVDRDMFMRYLGGGIGHQNQAERWTLSRGDEDVDDDDTDIDSPPEEDIDIDEDPEDDTQLQGLRELAIEMSSLPAGDDHDDITSDNNSDSDLDENEGSDEDELFPDDDEDSGEDEELDFGPDDGEADEDDIGFGDF